MTVEIVTFGCRLNVYESEVIRDNALKAGMDNAIVFNTCAVTSEAERQARQAIRKARREHPDARIIVTGCSAQVKPEAYAQMEEVDQVLGNEEKLKLSSFRRKPESHADGMLPEVPVFAGTTQEFWGEKILVNDIMSVKETALHMVTEIGGHARAFVQVQNGCDHRCTFCIIPNGRGNSRSVPVGEIVSQMRRLVEGGYREVVLTGVDISDYGKDLPGAPTLGQMMRRLLALVPELPRLRLSSIDAVEVDDELYRLIAEEPRLMPHIHISLQAGDDMILKRMKRRHNRKDALDFCVRVRGLRPDVVFGADIIAGFPTETEDMFANTLNMVEEADLTWLHVFPYSAREGTPAARMPQVPKDIRKARAERLREAGAKQVRRHFAAWQGRKTQAIAERNRMAHTDHFAPVRLDRQYEPGTLVHLEINGMDESHLHASVLS
jgi:threonylcarbamoyladenosine tRNA methylthiotransferase MtaB